MRTNIRFLLVLAMLFMLALTLPLAAQDEPEGAGELVTLFEGYLEAYSTNDTAALPQFLTEDHIRHQMYGDGEIVELQGIDAIAQMINDFHNDMPGVEFFIKNSVEHDNFLWVAGSSTELPDSDGVVLDYVLLTRWVDGKIDEIWVAGDEIAILSLLDALPTTQ